MLPSLFLLVSVIVDVRTRRFPFWLFVATCSAIWVFQAPPSFTGAFMGLILGLLADVPGGDLRFMVLFGLMIGPMAISITLASAFLLTVIAWNRGLTGVPWTVYMGLVYPAYSLLHSLVTPA